MVAAAEAATTSHLSVRKLLDRMPHSHWYNQADGKISSCYQHANIYGYLNPLRSIPVQLVDKVAVEWLYRLGDSELRKSPCFDSGRSLATIMCDNLEPNPNIRDICQHNDIALLRTSLCSNDVLDFMQTHIPRMLSPRCNKHGVFLAVMNTGVLITGASGIGKSEVALDLVQRGHQLIADDAVEIFRREGAELVGECPDTLKGYIEIRGLGIINIEKMFGPASVLDSYRLQLIINLKDATNEEIRDLDRLQPSMNQFELFGVEVPCLNMLVEPGRNLAVLVEAATRDHLLRMSGVDSSLEFINQHRKVMQAGDAE